MNYQLGITESFPCNYLDGQKERLLVATDTRLHNAVQYDWLMSQGFRRSGDQIYKPYCINCRACQSIRIPVKDFVASKSQKRNLKKNSELIIETSDHLKPEYWALFERYINEVHYDGAMYPANAEQYTSFLQSSITTQKFIELHDNNKLIAVAVTDDLDSALSAVYTFYDPQYKSRGIGVFCILKQIELAQQMGKNYLYLGYQIDECQKMNYKNRFHKHERLINNSWELINK